MSKRKKPDDEHREWCNRVLRVLAELPGRSVEKSDLRRKTTGCAEWKDQIQP